MGSLPTCKCKKKQGEEEVVFPQGQDNIESNSKKEQKASSLFKRNEKVTEEAEKSKTVNVKQNSETNATSLTNNNINNNNVIFPHNININNISRHNQSSFILPPIQNDDGKNILDVSSSVDNMAMEVYEDKIEIKVNESKASQSQIIENDLEVHFTNEDDLKKEKDLKDNNNIREELKEEEEKEENNDKKIENKEVISEGDSIKETEIRKNRSINEGGSEVISSLNKDIGNFIKKFNRNGNNNMMNSDDMFLTSRKWTNDGQNQQEKSISLDMQVNINKEEEDKKSYKSEEIRKSKLSMDLKEEIINQENYEEEDKMSEVEKEEKKNEDVGSEEGNEEIYENEENHNEKPEKIKYNNNDYQSHKSEEYENKKNEEENNNHLPNVNIKKNTLINNIDKIKENNNKVEIKEQEICTEIPHVGKNENENDKEQIKNEYKNEIKLETPYKSDKVSVRTNEVLKSLISHCSASSNKEYEDGNYVATTNGNNSNNNSKIEKIEPFKNPIKDKDVIVVPTTNGIVGSDTNANSNQPQTKETISSHHLQNDCLVLENKKNNYEVSSPISHSILNITTHANHFDVQSTKEIQEALFTLPSQAKQKTEEKEVLSECNPIQIDLTLSNDNFVPTTAGKAELLQQSFDIEIVSEHNLTQVNSKAKIKSKASKVKMEGIKEKENKISKLQPKFLVPRSPLFIDVLFYSELNKYIQNTYDIKLHKGLLYAKRFCALTKTRFEYYTSKEQFILLQKPTCAIQSNKIKQARLISLKEINKKIKSKIKNHFEILYYTDSNNYNNLNNTHANENAIYEAENEDEHEQLLKVIFASDKEEIAKYWVTMINSNCFINKN